MLSKEEIEEAKERISKGIEDVCFSTLYSQEENEADEKILLQYIKDNPDFGTIQAIIIDYKNMLDN